MKITKQHLRKIIKEETEGALNESMLNFGLAVKGAKDTANWARERDGRQNSPRSTSAIVKDLAGLVGKKKKKKTWMQQRGDLAQDIAKEIREIDVGEDIKDGLIQAAEILAHGRSEFWAKSLIDMVEQIVLLSDEVTPPEVMKKQGEKYKEDRSRLVRLFPLLDDLLPIVEEANEYAPKMPQRFISKGNLEERKGSQVMKITKNQLRKIIKEEIKKTLSEAPKPNEKPDWLDQEEWEIIQKMDQKKYDAFFADAIAQRAEEEEERTQWYAKEDEARAKKKAGRAAARAGKDRLKSMQGEFGAESPAESPAGEPQDWDVSDQEVYLKGKWVPLEDGFDRTSTHSTALTNSPGNVANRLMDAAEIYNADDRDDLLDIFTDDVFYKIEDARGAEKLAKPISKGKFFEVKIRKRR